MKLRQQMKQKKKNKTYSNGNSHVVTHRSTTLVDLWFKYGRADGMPCFPQSMAVCARMNVLIVYDVKKRDTGELKRT